MHIVIIADPLDKQSAGIYYFAKNLVMQLLEIDNKNTYSIIKLNSSQTLENTDFISLKNTFTFFRNDPWRTFVSLPKLIKKLNPDVVIELAHFGPFNLPKKIKRVTIIHDITPSLFPHFHKLSSQIIQRLFFPSIIKRADLLITNSKNTSTDLIKHYPKAECKSKIIYLGKSNKFVPLFSEKKLNQYKIRNPYFFTVSTIEPRKNLNVLLDAYKIFRSNSEKKIGLVISGGIGWKSKTFFKSYYNHPFKNDIRLIGYTNRQDLPYLYSQTEAFIFPSLYEGFGLPLLEAMSCGAACISSNTSSLPEVCEDAAIYFNPHSSKELSLKMELIVTDEKLQKKLKRRSIDQAKNFSWKKYAHEFIQIIEDKFS